MYPLDTGEILRGKGILTANILTTCSMYTLKIVEMIMLMNIICE